MPEKNTLSLADEIDAALAEVSPPPADEPEDEAEAEAETPESDEPEGDEPESDEPESDEPEGDDEGEDEGDAEDEADEAAEEDAGEAAAAAKAAKQPKEPDAVNDPIPKGLNEKTEKRMRTLIDTVKSLTGERDSAKQNNDFLVNTIRDTGATPQQYGETLGFLKLLNSGDKEQQKTALALAKQVVLNIAAIVGEPVGELDVLSAHPDLLTRVNAGKLTRADAEELALARNNSRLRTSADTAVRNEQQQQQQRQTAVAAGRQALNELEAELRSSDPRYIEKRAKLLADSATMTAINKLPPDQWAGAFSRAFLRIKLASKPAPTGVPANQPMRARARAGRAAGEPKSMLDAINGALAEMGK